MRSLVIGAHLLEDDVEPIASAVPAGDLFLSAIRIEKDQPLGDRELLLRVASLRAKLLEVATFVAIRYGFTVSGAEEAQWKCAAHISSWKVLLTENRENVEMTLKVASDAPRPRPDRTAFAHGADYLRALYDATRSASAEPRFRAEAEELLLPLALRHRWLQRDEKSLELVLLVPRKNLERMSVAGETLRARMPDAPFLLSGPWPLEVFAE
jgi:hypothetical protein